MRIVLTGGPGAGKTTVAAALATTEPQAFALVPEAATRVYDLLRTRWDRLDAEGRRDVQRRIFRLQREQEELADAAHPGNVLLLDRGSVDGAAYWPDGAEDYFRDVGTTHAAELRRYDAVIWMESAAALGIYGGCSSNPCRFEDPAAAIAIGQRLFDVWNGHPALHRIQAFPSIDEKIAAVRAVMEQLMRGRSACSS